METSVINTYMLSIGKYSELELFGYFINNIWNDKLIAAVKGKMPSNS